VSLRDAKIPASDLDALKEDRILASLVVQDMQGNIVYTVEANTPIILSATVEVDVADGKRDFACLLLSENLSLTASLLASVPEFKYVFEPIIDPLTPLSASEAQVAARTPRWKEVEFLSRVVAFSGPADGIFVPDNKNSETVESKAGVTHNATAVVCLFADGVHKFRVRIWTPKDEEVGEEHSVVGTTSEPEREATCVVHVRTETQV
jgi:hypothetical protein